MKKIEPGKRSDPGKLAREREAIRKDKESRETPRHEAMEKPHNFLLDVIEHTKKKINIRRQRKQGYGYPPRVPGALQVGHKPEDKTA